MSLYTVRVADSKGVKNVVVIARDFRDAVAIVLKNERAQST